MELSSKAGYLYVLSVSTCLPLNISSTQEGGVLGQLESHFSFSTLWDSGIEFRSSSLLASTFINGAISLAHHLVLKYEYDS